jgi:hypothetical protein
VKPLMQFAELAATEVAAFTLDITKAKRELHWSPAIDMNLGLATTKRWIEKGYLGEDSERVVANQKL